MRLDQRRPRKARVVELTGRVDSTEKNKRAVLGK